MAYPHKLKLTGSNPFAAVSLKLSQSKALKLPRSSVIELTFDETR